MPRSSIDAITADMRIVVLHGWEPFLIAEATARYAAVLAEAWGDVTRFTIDGEAAELATVLDELRSYSLFGPHKLVVVDNAEEFLVGPERRRPMEAYAAKPTPEASLLLRAESWKPGNFDKAVAKVGAVIKCEPLKDDDAAGWCVRVCPQRHGRKIERAAADLLVEQLGTGLYRLDMELAKLAAFTEAPAIGLDDVRELVGRSREERGWALQAAILSGDAAEAVSKLQELREISRIELPLVSWAICDLLRRLHAAARMIRRGTGLRAVRERLKLFRDTGDRTIEIARRRDPAVFARLLQRTVDETVQSRLGRSDEQRNLEAMTLLVTDTIRCP